MNKNFIVGLSVGFIVGVAAQSVYTVLYMRGYMEKQNANQPQ